MTQEQPPAEKPTQEGKDKDGNLISPPQSPEGKLGLKRALDDALSKSQGWMPIKPLNTNRSHICGFLSSYNNPQFNPKVVKKPKSKYSSIGSSSKQSRENQADFESRASEGLTAELKNAGSINSQSGYKSSSSDVSTREYGTRSKKKKTQAEDGPDSPVIESAAVQSESSSGNYSNPSYEATDLPDILNTNGGWSLPMADKVKWLDMSSVQVIHDSDISRIPDYEPELEWDDAEFIKVMKKLGLIGATKNARLDRSLKKFSSQEISILNALKLTPLQFIDTKKRFFAEKARKTSHKLNFKKTDAQKACKIDVNKASKLYEIYQACGFLEDELFFE